MQKTLIILFIFLGCFHCIQAQEGVSINEDGSAADGSAILDVKSTSKGMLIPRVNLVSTASQSPITSTPAVGLLVFNLATSNDVHKIILAKLGPRAAASDARETAHPTSNNSSKTGPLQRRQIAPSPPNLHHEQ